MKHFYQKACPPARNRYSVSGRQCLKPSFCRRGITLLEVMIVIVIIGIIVAVVLPQFSDIKKSQLLKNTGEDVVSTLNKARSQTLGSLDSSQYGVHFQSDKLILFKGTAFSDGNASNEVINVVSPVTLSDISLTGGSSNIYFSRLNGMPSVFGTITISNGTSSKIITISATGGVSIN